MQALRVLVRTRWFEIEQTAGELRIRLGHRAGEALASQPIISQRRILQ